MRRLYCASNIILQMSRLEKMEARRDPLRSEGGLLSSVGSIYVSIKSVPAPEKLKLLINLAGGKASSSNIIEHVVNMSWHLYYITIER